MPFLNVQINLKNCCWFLFSCRRERERERERESLCVCMCVCVCETAALGPEVCFHWVSIDGVEAVAARYSSSMSVTLMSSARIYSSFIYLFTYLQLECVWDNNVSKYKLLPEGREKVYNNHLVLKMEMTGWSRTST